MTRRALTRRQFGAAVGGGLAAWAAVRSVAAGVPAPDAADGFPFGTHVYREPHLPLDEIRRDLPLLKRLGLNMVKVQESWAIDEKREGEVDLANVARVISDAREQGLSVFFGVTMEQAPAWLWKKHPDAVPVYENGEPVNDPTPYLLPSDGKPGPCWHHAGARAAAERFLRAASRDLGRFDNVRVWSVWQEVGFFPWDFRPGRIALCYCPSTLAAYRAWLEARYASLDALNGAWKTGYGEWAEIEPPRRFRAVPSWIDWRLFMEVVSFEDALRWKGDALGGEKGNGRTIMGHINGPAIGGSHEWRWARAVDLFGTSYYPLWGDPPYWSAVLLKTDFVRSASRDGNFWTAELQGGPVSQNLVLGRVPTPAEIRRWVLGSVGLGARGVCFWNHRAERLWSEGYGFGLLDSVGDRTERADEAGRLARALASEADLLAHGTHPEPAVAIVVGEDLLHFFEASGDETKAAYVDSVSGLWKALWDEAIPAAFVPLERLAEDAGRYRALLLPFPVALGEDAVEALRAFVKAGGTLVSEACPGRFNREGLGFAGEMAPGLVPLFGARHASLEPVEKPRDGASPARWAGTGRIGMQTLVPSFRAQTFLPTTGEPVAMDGAGRAVAVHNAFGAGHAWLFGTLLGHASLRGDGSHGRVIAEVLAPAGVRADRCGPLVRRRRVRGTKQAWFLFNPREEEVTAEVPLRGASARDLLGEPVEAAAGGVRLRVAPLDVRCLVVEGAGPGEGVS